MGLKEVVRTIPDFPEKGILFRDITTILQDAGYLHTAVDELTALLADIEFDAVLGPESRGFLFGVPLAYKLNKGFIPVRKMGKLPFTTVRKTYSLEYGNATLEMHVDAIKPGQRVVIVDDLLATGGTCKAIAEMVEDIGGEIAATVFLIELENLGGRQLLERYPVRSVLQY